MLSFPFPFLPFPDYFAFPMFSGTLRDVRCLSQLSPWQPTAASSTHGQSRLDILIANTVHFALWINVHCTLLHGSPLMQVAATTTTTHNSLVSLACYTVYAYVSRSFDSHGNAPKLRFPLHPPLCNFICIGHGQPIRSRGRRLA